MLTLYIAPNTIAVAAAIALNEAGLEHKIAPVDFKAKAQQTPEYLAINPKGRVPALETPEGILTEVGAVLDYIAAQAPGAGLVPDDPFQAGRMREVMYYLASTMHVNHAHKMRGARWADQTSSFEDMRAKVPETMAASCAYLESVAGFDPFVLGERFTLADPYVYAIATWLEGDAVDPSAFPKLAAHRAMMAERPSVAAVHAAGMLG